MSKYAEDLAHRIVSAEQHQDKLRERFPDHSEDELRALAVETADSPQTECFVFVGSGPHQGYREADKFYNGPNNIAMVNPRDETQEATIFQPENGRDWFDKQLAESMRLENKDSIEVYRGIEELELGRARMLAAGEVEQVGTDVAAERSHGHAIDRAVEEQAATNIEAAYGTSATAAPTADAAVPAAEPAVEPAPEPGMAPG